MVDAAAFQAMMGEAVPMIAELGIRVLELADGKGRFLLPASDRLLRPGGTIAGPAQMALVDIAMYGLILSRLGRVDLAVTTNLSINFLRRPAPADLIAEAKLLKLGKRLAVGDVLLYSAGLIEPVAQASVTYSIPPR